VTWTAASASTSTGDAVAVSADAASPSGYSLAFTYKGSADLADDGWAEQPFKLPKLTEVFVCMVIASPANYVHRDASGPDNNKLLRLWDTDYGNSTVHIGMSTLPTTGGTSQMITEFHKTGSAGTGNWGTGPWNVVFRPATVDTIGFYAKVATSSTVQDGIIRIWWNNRLVYDRNNLALKEDGRPGGNWFENGYVLGWANSGFTQTTTLRLRKFLVAKRVIGC
jgi:hypothetical protein